MYHFFIEPSQIEEGLAIIKGNDVNHIKNVLRLSVDEEIVLCDKEGNDYFCQIASLTNDEIRCKIHSKGKSSSELPNHITLFQGTPKQDKMELIIQKAVELGVYDIVPVQMRRSIVKYDAKKLKKKLLRWSTISESAAKQSKRGVVPDIKDLHTFKQLLTELDSYDRVIIPYENENGMKETREVFKSIEPGEKVAIVIGPEGGFDKEEIENLRETGGLTVTLGNRILRTETAGLATLAMISYQTEEA